MGQDNGGASKGSRLFSASERAEILQRQVGKTTGVICEIGGIPFNLVALRSRQMLEMLTHLQVKPDEMSPAQFEHAVTFIHDYLWDCGGRSGIFNCNDKETQEWFEAWFDVLDINVIAPALFEKIVQANAPRPPEPSTSATGTSSS